MKWTAVGAVLALLILVLAFYDVRANRPATFRGEIMDSRCAQMGSHEAVMKMQGFQTPLQCALFCAHYLQNPSAWVLYDANHKTVYQLNDQENVQPYAAEKVAITGTYDAASKTILVTAITATP
jgi:hypothetical protein